MIVGDMPSIWLIYIQIMMEQIMAAFLVDVGPLDIAMGIDESLSYRSSDILTSWLNIDGAKRPS